MTMTMTKERVYSCDFRTVLHSCNVSSTGRHWLKGGGGFWANGEVTYIDSVMAPFPAIRFKEDKGEIATLRLKEQGDWNKMTLEEKKALYRASFCQTLLRLRPQAETGSRSWGSSSSLSASD